MTLQELARPSIAWSKIAAQLCIYYCWSYLHRVGYCVYMIWMICLWHVCCPLYCEAGGFGEPSWVTLGMACRLHDRVSVHLGRDEGGASGADKFNLSQNVFDTW